MDGSGQSECATADVAKSIVVQQHALVNMCSEFMKFQDDVVSFTGCQQPWALPHSEEEILGACGLGK